MEKNLIDQNDLSFDKSFFKNIGIGIFYYLTVFNTFFIFNNIVRELLMLNNVTPKLNFWLTETLTLLLIAITTNLFLNKLRNGDNKNSFVLILIISLVTFLLKVLFQSYFPFILEINKEIILYNRTILDSTFYSILLILFDFLSYLVIALIIFRKART